MSELRVCSVCDGPGCPWCMKTGWEWKNKEGHLCYNPDCSATHHWLAEICQDNPAPLPAFRRINRTSKAPS